jgi:tetratricopeptide (TPR) repeat protein
MMQCAKGALQPPGKRLEPCRVPMRPSQSAACVQSIMRDQIVRSSVSVITASVLLAIAALVPATAAEAEPPVVCAALTVAPPERLIESCTALIDNPAMPDADRYDAMITRAVAWHDSGQTDKALAEIDTVIARDPARARAFRARGEIFRQTGQVDRAFGALNEAVRLDPGNAYGFESRGNAFNNAKKYDRAIEDYNEALRLKPDFAQAFSDRGAAWYFKGEYQKAIDDYDQAIRIDPTQPEFFDNRGLHLADNNDYDRAIADYDEAIKLRPEAKFLTNRGDAYQGKKDYDRAIADYDAALKLDPKFSRAYNNRGAAYRKKGDRVRALQDYAAAIRLDPGDKTAASNHKEIALEVERLGALMSQKNLPSFNCATAKRAVEKAICADPELARLDSEINGMFLRVVADQKSRRDALALTQQQRDFIAKRNASFGKRGYDLRVAMEARLKAITGVDGY